MASISRQPKGLRTIQFASTDGRRRSIRLGKVSQRQAEAVKIKVEQLIAFKLTGHATDDETSRWVSGLDDVLRDRIAAVGLIPKRASATLGAFLDEYISSRIDVKRGTKVVYGHTRKNLIAHLGARKPLREINAGDADEWRFFLIRQGLSENTVRRRCGIAKQFL